MRTYTVNLDLSPEHRWSSVIEGERDRILASHRELLGFLGPWVDGLRWIGGPLAWMRSGSMMYYNEINSVATGLGLPVFDVLLCQIAYEICASCTTIMCPEGRHIRTMDWPLDALRNVTVRVNFQRGGATVLRTITWAGYIGVLTGLRPGGYSVSINYRPHGGLGIARTLVELVRCSRWPVGYLVRETMLATANYREAIDTFQRAQLISPTYICVCSSDEATVITRDTNGVAEARSSSQATLVQTNRDFTGDNTNVLWSQEREQLAARSFQTQGSRTWEQLRNVFKRHPIRNQITIYVAEMDVNEGWCDGEVIPAPTN